MKPLEPISSPIPSTLAEADQILHAYGRWAMNRWKPQRCGSAERYYTGERLDEQDQRREPRELLIPAKEAMRAQRALQKVAEPWRIVLTALYIPQRLPAIAILAKRRIPPKLARERHLDGLFMFRNVYRGME